MRTLKKLLAAALGAALLAGLALPAAAQAPAEPIPVNVATYGTVTVTQDGRLYLKCPDDAHPLSQVVLGPSSHTLILDAVTLEPVALDAIQDGDLVYAWADPIMALSMPPQAGVQLILVNIPADYAVPTYHQIVSAKMSGDGSATTLLTDKNQTFVVDGDCQLSPYLTRNLLLLESLTPGTMILLWQENMAGEGQAPVLRPSRIVAFPYAYAGWLEIEDGQVLVSGEAVGPAGGQASAFAGELLPLRAVCERLGWQVSWDAQARAITVTRESTDFRLTIGADTVLVEGDMLPPLLAAPAIVDGRTQVAAEDLARLLGLYYPAFTRFG